MAPRQESRTGPDRRSLCRCRGRERPREPSQAIWIVASNHHTGQELSEEDIEALADEAERGYDLDKAIRVTIRRPIALPAEALLDRWRNLPAVDPDALRADIDRTLDGTSEQEV
jgi:hypothetical protein